MTDDCPQQAQRPVAFVGFHGCIGVADRATAAAADTVEEVFHLDRKARFGMKGQVCHRPVDIGAILGSLVVDPWLSLLATGSFPSYLRMRSSRSVSASGKAP